MFLCIFCENELTTATKPEHILLDGLGGRKTTKKAICSDCNNHFGNTIDKAITAQVANFRNLFGLASGTGKLPPALRTENKQGERVLLRGDGIPQLVQKPFSVTPDENGGVNIEINARDEVHLAQIIPDIAAQLRLTENEVWNLLEDADGAFVSRRVGPMHQRLSLGGEDSLRSISKAALCLIASVVGTEPIRTVPFSDVRNFVVGGGDEFNRERGTLDPRRLAKSGLLEERFGPLFNLLYVRSDDQGRTLARFTLYNIVSWQVVLAERGGRPNLNLAVASNPLDPKVWSDRIATELDIPFNWLNSPDSTNVLQATAGRMNAVMQAWAERSTPQAIHHVADRIFRRHGITDDNQVINDHECFEQLIAELAGEVAHYIVGLPSKQKIKLDDIKRMRSRRDDDEN